MDGEDTEGAGDEAQRSDQEHLDHIIEPYNIDVMYDEVDELLINATDLIRRVDSLQDAILGVSPESEPNISPPASGEHNQEEPPEQAAAPQQNEDANVDAQAAGDGNESEISLNDSASSEMSIDSPRSEDDSDIEAMPRWNMSENRMQSAVDMLVSQARNSDGGIAGLLNRNNFLQRVRHMVFSQDRLRGRRNDEPSSELSGDGEDRLTTPAIVPAPPLDFDMEGGVSFDTNLPAEHSYLGTNVNRVPGVDYLEVGSTHRMLIFVHHHILFPGEVLPFMIDGNIIEDEMEGSGRDGVIFAVGFPLLLQDVKPLKLYGVTCQIYERGVSGHQMVFKSRALQRVLFNTNENLQYIARNPTRKCYGDVKILPEYFLPEPLKCIDLGSMNRFRDIPSMHDKFRRFQMTSTPWPQQACEDYSFTDIVERARKKLELHKIDTMPKCPIQLSFWLVRNLHLTEKMMRQTFLTDSVNTRLKLIGSTLKEESLFFCRYCNSSLAYCSDLFAMSKHGVQTQYCNSAGFIHETNTVYRVLPHAVGYSGEPSTEFCWFPGYQWHIILCKFCAQHVGWEYKAIEENLAPKVFYGLAGSSVRIGKANEDVPLNNSNFVVRNLLRLVSNEME